MLRAESLQQGFVGLANALMPPRKRASPTLESQLRSRRGVRMSAPERARKRDPAAMTGVAEHPAKWNGVG